MEGQRPRTVFLSAGESSGDLHGARLAHEIRSRRPDVRLVGLGGSRMRQAGVELLADLDTLAVMGFAEILRSLPDLWRVRRRVRRFLRDEAPDLLVPIDYPGFNLSLSCWAQKRGVAVLYYIAPQVWAWHASRARKLARCTDHICVVLPFEEAFLREHGADAEFVGHPLLDGDVPRSADEEAFDPPVLGLFPGSRLQELERILPPFLDAADRLEREMPALRVLIGQAPDLGRDRYPKACREMLAPVEEVLESATAALAKSGTITLQLALAGVPMVVGYRTNPLTYWLARHLVEVDHVALVNLVAGRRLVPELLQGDLTGDALARGIRPFLRRGGQDRESVVEGLEEVRRRLGRPGCTDRVAERVVELVEGTR